MKEAEGNSKMYGKNQKMKSKFKERTKKEALRERKK